MISAPGTSSPRPTFSENIRFDQPVRIYFGNPSEVLEGAVASEAEDGLPQAASPTMLRNGAGFIRRTPRATEQICRASQ
jgi:hypothetical protein